METKHTSAPWYIRYMGHDTEDNGENDFFVEANNNKEKVGHATEIMQDDYGDHNGYPREQRMADAKLIASAPDLLEALQEILMYCGDATSNVSGAKLKNTLPFHKAIYAISKATK